MGGRDINIAFRVPDVPSQSIGFACSVSTQLRNILYLWLSQAWKNSRIPYRITTEILRIWLANQYYHLFARKTTSRIPLLRRAKVRNSHAFLECEFHKTLSRNGSLVPWFRGRVDRHLPMAHFNRSTSTQHSKPTVWGTGGMLIV